MEKKRAVLLALVGVKVVRGKEGDQSVKPIAVFVKNKHTTSVTINFLQSTFYT
jgi:hypothetical protein